MIYRKHTRLPGFDYTASYWYFVTICTDFRKALFVPKVSEKYGDLLRKDVVAGLVPANSSEVTTRIATTNSVEDILLDEIPQRFSVESDFYVFMPNHLHWIITLMGDHKGRNYSLGQIVGAFKSLTTRAMWKTGYKGRLWQPNFYEHIIRDENSLDRIRKYILYNPLVEYFKIPWKKLDPEQ